MVLSTGDEFTFSIPNMRFGVKMVLAIGDALDYDWIKENK